jgi:hypothetical protein
VALLAAIVLSVGWIIFQVFTRLRGVERAVAEERAKERLAGVRTVAALERVGAVPDRPIVVESAATIEPRAQSEPCPICSGHLHVDEHVVDESAGLRLRRLDMRCGDCGRHSRLYFQVHSAAPN